ncbi:MAG: hypothetical protein HYX61_01655 [Gammaproteobacteria bacterium]|jgi:hypothetical protein|nr:hypothetical protein [Gammaproteobacteria bacterium]
MTFLYRNIIICEVKKLENQGKRHICYVPELIYLQSVNATFNKSSFTQPLKSKFQQIAQFHHQYGSGALPLSLSTTKSFMEDLYNELLKNNITLPPNMSELDLRYIIKDYEWIKNHIFTYDLKIKIQRDNLSFFAKYLPRIGTLVTFTLTVGLTISTLITIVGWGWSLILFSIFGLSKLLTSFADISGGPERRMLLLGSWIDRLRTGHYEQFGKQSIPKIALNSLVVILLGCSSLLTWYGAWQLIRCMNGMSEVPYLVATTLAGLFAWSSAGANFGRIYQDLYQLLFNYFSTYVSFDSFKEQEKINFKQLRKGFSCENTITSSLGVSSVITQKPKVITFSAKLKKDEIKTLEASAIEIQTKRHPRSPRNH